MSTFTRHLAAAVFTTAAAAILLIGAIGPAGVSAPAATQSVAHQTRLVA